MIDWTFAKSISDAENWKHDRANIIRIGASRTAVSGGRAKRLLARVFSLRENSFGFRPLTGASAARIGEWVCARLDDEPRASAGERVVEPRTAGRHTQGIQCGNRRVC